LFGGDKRMTLPYQQSPMNQCYYFHPVRVCIEGVVFYIIKRNVIKFIESIIYNALLLFIAAEAVWSLSRVVFLLFNLSDTVIHSGYF